MKAVVLAALAACASGCVPGQFTLVNNGRATAQIVTGAQAPETVVFAAKELQTFVRKMSGAELPIVSQPVAGIPAIRLGPAARAVVAPADLQSIQRDGYVIAVTNADLCIVGIDDADPPADIEALLKKGETESIPAWSFHRGTLYGVYRFLEALGVRWYVPGDFGERVPKCPTLAFAGTIRENPHFISRRVGSWRLDKGYYRNIKKNTIMPGERAEIGFTPVENRLWELRMRGASFQIPLNHYPTATRWVERFGKTHPEYFAMLPGGERDNTRSDGGHLCYTCPGVVDESVADIQAYAAGKESEARGLSRIHPTTRRSLNDDNRGWPPPIAFGEYFSLLPHDGFRPCGCAECAKLISSDGIKGMEHSRLVWPYVVKCAEKVPDRKITCLAYGSYSRPYPGMQKLPPNVTVGFCAYSHPGSLYYKDDFESYEKLVAEWAALTHGNLAFWQHYLASNRSEETVGMPEHTPEMYANVIRVMARYGNHVFCEQLADSIMFEALNRYLLLKLFYDPTLDEKKVVDDFINGFYGPAAGPIIGEIYADIGAKSVQRFRHRYAAYSIWEKLFSEKTMRDYQAKTDLAIQKAAGTPYAAAVSAFKKYYLGLMERGRARYADPLAQLLAAFNPELVSRRVTKAFPVIDGKLDEPAWKTAVSVTMGNNVNGKATAHMTEVRACHDTQSVYVAVSAVDPGVGTRPVENGNPGAVDGVDLYLDVPHNHQGYYRVAVDLSGRTYDYHYIDHIELGRPDWRSHAVAAVTRGDSNYVMEVAIPLASLGAPTGSLDGVEWGILVGRTDTHAASTNDRQSSTSMLLRERFEQANYFNHLVFKDK